MDFDKQSFFKRQCSKRPLMTEVCVIFAYKHKFAQRAVGWKQLIINSSPLIIVRMKCKWKRTSSQSWLWKLATVTLAGAHILCTQNFRGKGKIIKLAIFRALPALTFEIKLKLSAFPAQG